MIAKQISLSSKSLLNVKSVFNSIYCVNRPLATVVSEHEQKKYRYKRYDEIPGPRYMITIHNEIK